MKLPKKIKKIVTSFISLFSSSREKTEKIKETSGELLTIEEAEIREFARIAKERASYGREDSEVLAKKAESNVNSNTRTLIVASVALATMGLVLMSSEVITKFSSLAQTMLTFSVLLFLLSVIYFSSSLRHYVDSHALLSFRTNKEAESIEEFVLHTESFLSKSLLENEYQKKFDDFLKKLNKMKSRLDPLDPYIEKMLRRNIAYTRLGSWFFEIAIIVLMLALSFDAFIKPLVRLI